MVGWGSRLPFPTIPAYAGIYGATPDPPPPPPASMARGFPMLSTSGSWASLRAELMDALARERRKRDRTGEGGRWGGNGGMGKPPPLPKIPACARITDATPDHPHPLPGIRGKGLSMLSTPEAWASLRAGLMDVLAWEWRRRDRTGEGGRWGGDGGMGKPPPLPKIPACAGITDATPDPPPPPPASMARGSPCCPCQGLAPP